MNCDFSSINNIWARFYFLCFCGLHFEFVWVIFFMTDWLEFRLWVFWQPFWTGILYFGFRLQISEVPDWAFALLNSLDINLLVKWNRIQSAQYTYWLVSLLTQCCITIRDDSPTFNQHWFNVLCLNRIATVILIVAFKRFQLSIPITHSSGLPQEHKNV